MLHLTATPPSTKLKVTFSFYLCEIFGLYILKFPSCDTESFRKCCYGLRSLIKKTIVFSLLFFFGFMNTLLVTDDDTASDDGNGDLSRDENK